MCGWFARRFCVVRQLLECASPLALSSERTNHLNEEVATPRATSVSRFWRYRLDALNHAHASRKAPEDWRTPRRSRDCQAALRRRLFWRVSSGFKIIPKRCRCCALPPHSKFAVGFIMGRGKLGSPWSACSKAQRRCRLGIASLRSVRRAHGELSPRD